jgi:DUF971 family protein
MPVPTEIRLIRAERRLDVSFSGGAHFMLPAEYLRVESPSAEVQGHSPDQRITVAGKRHVGITALEPVGNYAIRIIFDDKHETGIFSWDLLHDLGQNFATRWAAYLQSLAAKNLTRDGDSAPPRMGCSQP